MPRNARKSHRCPRPRKPKSGALQKFSTGSSWGCLLSQGKVPPRRHNLPALDASTPGVQPDLTAPHPHDVYRRNPRGDPSPADGARAPVSLRLDQTPPTPFGDPTGRKDARAFFTRRPQSRAAHSRSGMRASIDVRVARGESRTRDPDRRRLRTLSPSPARIPRGSAPIFRPPDPRLLQRSPLQRRGGF